MGQLRQRVLRGWLGVVSVELRPACGRPPSFSGDIWYVLHIRGCVDGIKKCTSVDSTDSLAWLYFHDICFLFELHRLIDKVCFCQHVLPPPPPPQVLNCETDGGGIDPRHVIMMPSGSTDTFYGRLDRIETPCVP
ncbi:hypothetical protein BDV37DRAFT_54890 [Aspergillus pseudonomiae]|uniref:Uncharacterized protein n=1 Tax=Aspergillus pseudonomiae TaxID=1506151 RepID=A0A5N7CV88_9EURO|nr:uncharacterized protein BDV37DRAFT_54890 [Aspergillus pseudonomiae]KAE8397548.1 hypothetical protein BDV37DRAFT_54890 [Aspergillus pseudonomiae]